ncbi:FAD-dependent oxidoreductase [Larkinella soli]|uniref:FAD-dependent oxidoreductase n=1 Tax=Larkinella soli TaxID=1770527 RepID=UPI000FFBAED3|nr:FAD-dependent oxidoreductase [Larkinella soli]
MRFLKLLCLTFLSFPALAQQQQVDICVYGGTSGGVMAAYTARMMGKSVLLIEPGRHLGGMSSGGLGYTDIGNKYAISGLALDFYRRIGRHYGRFEQWTFEPKVAEALFNDYVKRAGVPVVYERRVIGVKKAGPAIQDITLENSARPGSTALTVRASIFIDCSYEGDLMAKAGVSYAVGREDNRQYNETYNGVQLMTGHQLPDGIDPYRTPGNPESGLLWGVSAEKLLPAGSGDRKVQAYNYRICLTRNPANRIPITRPADYDSTRYELLIRLIEKKPWKTLNDGFIWSLMPNDKTDINNRNGFSTDMIGMNWDYPEASYQRREEIIRQHESYTKGLLYFVGHDARVPQAVREQMQQWGYPKDEYTDNGHWSPQLYVREARRMIGAYVMTQANCQGREVVEDAVGMAAYTMDSHNIQRIVIEKDGVRMAKNEGNVEIGGFPPYPIAYRSLTPKAAECTNLLVPVCLSATHIAYGSIRMEPVFMVLGQSSAVAAAMAIDGKTGVQNVDVKKLQARLRDNPLADGSAPDVLVDNDNREAVTLTGNWQTEKKGGYGPSLLIDERPGEGAKTAVFTPNLTRAGRYSVYTYFPRLKNETSVTHFTVFDGRQAKEVPIRTAEVVVQGQTSGEWVSLGTYDLPQGRKASVTVSGKEADGVVVADAVLFVPAGK